jgi:glycerol-3-phosphate acyltransferase PlsY
VNLYLFIALWLSAFALGAFLIGSIPFGYLIGRLFYRRDIRAHGSGNIGAMNALRTLGKSGAVAVLLLDALKGFAPTLYLVSEFRGVANFGMHGIQLGFSLPHVIGSLVAAAAVLGHCFSPWLRFKGGKGVATSFGAVFGLCWPAGLVVVGVWLLGAFLTRYSSVGSMLGSIAAPFALWGFTRSPAETLYGVFAALLIIYTHRENIGRLKTGTEGPIKLSGRSG